MSDTELRRRLDAVRERIARAAERAGRDTGAVEVMAVTKGHPAITLRDVASAGLQLVGENRVREAEEKAEAVRRLGLRWHMVGHLQRNKARRAVRLFDAVESVDSLRLARVLDAECARLGKDRLEVLAQVNTSGEETKGGFSGPGALEEIAAACELPRLHFAGLMTMAPLTSDEAVLRSVFRRTRELCERCSAEVSGFEGRVLSMGMSNDFVIAVEEGSTRVRLGTVLLGERPLP
ncbi:MAG: YggS family pyridoxal phosphate-dependent enzyme [Gemmatimonadota bacterium]